MVTPQSHGQQAKLQSQESLHLCSSAITPFGGDKHGIIAATRERVDGAAHAQAIRRFDFRLEPSPKCE
jgi:hypothetical protein